jgi:hypothetical protein
MAGIPDSLKQRGVHQLFRTTLQGHKRPDLAIDHATFLLHTTTCTYALDDEGICRDIISKGERLPRGVERCRGAQYVACLFRDSDDGMVGDPRVGGRALFVGRGTGLRMALLKTGRITGIEHIDTLGNKREPSMPVVSRWSETEIDLGWSLEPSKAAAQTYLGLPKPTLDNDVIQPGALSVPATPRLAPRKPQLPPRKPTSARPAPPRRNLNAPLRPPRP